jgi:isocitrate dehydrogenase
MVSKMAEPREMMEKNADGLVVPDHPFIPYIEGDGIGPEI